MIQSEEIFESKIGNPCLIIAEIGGNHEGDFNRAKKLTIQALNSGADYVKFQIYKANGIVNKFVDPERYEHFKKFVLSKTQFEELFRICEGYKKGSFMASLWDIEDFDWYNRLVNIHKVGSGDLTNFPIIKKIVESKKPIILSTGISDWDLIRKTLSFIYSLDKSYKKKIALLHCSSLYPCSEGDLNLKNILYLKKLSNLQVGYSDHSVGNLSCEIAYSLGASIIEKHFTDNKKDQFRDHQISSNKDDLIKLITKLKRVKKIHGELKKEILNNEIKLNHHSSFRRSIYANKEIKKGEVLSAKNILTLRPKGNNCATDYFNILGKRVTKKFEKLEEIDLKYLE